MKIDTYTHGHERAAVDSHRRRNVQNSAAYLLPYLKPEMSLLDVGCETGTITRDFRNFVAKVTGLDVDEAVISRAKAEYAEVSSLDFKVGNLYQLPFADNSFDVVHAHQVLQHLSEPAAALKEMARVTKPNGIIAVRDADYSTFTWYPRFPEMDYWLELYHQVVRHNQAEPDAAPRLLAWAHQAGLNDNTFNTSSIALTGTQAKDWGESWAERVIHSSFSKQAEELGLANPKQLAAISEAWKRWAASPDAVFAFLHGELISKIHK